MPVLLKHQGGDIGSNELARLKKQAAILLHLTGQPRSELSLLLVDDRQMQEFNHLFRQRNRPTNVLAFAQREAPEIPGGLGDEMLGDVVISLDTARREARAAGVSPGHRLAWLLTHGLLHLLGYDHEQSSAEAERMAEAEEALLHKLQEHERKSKMTQLAVNVDHVATLRQARGINEPDPVLAAGICELAGAEGIVVHLREDRRHIQDRDVLLLRQTVKSKLNLEMAAAAEIIDFALRLKPDMVTLVPEKRRELTTEGGLNVKGQQKKLAKVIKEMNQAQIPVSLFVDPDPGQIAAAAAIGASFVEIHTGRYCDAPSEEEREREFALVAQAAEEALAAGLRVNAGHGLNYLTTARVAALGTIEELSIGHAIMARAILVGLEKAVAEMRAIIKQASPAFT
ncbi:pyridoxine 5'-phosphate synthase [Desulfurivibrio alkaliphilus]|uniref:Multifunctional fusion protein n=1 Tax=Desulfurivibrio alkaliphilus (strain DSM 19089 / UNIQEM U267 / AHT2) TaxID=589865 RepID=D6Z002_DESAT|nr:pyridoxine 5'-phosphate synthase [Desulfurivibrio alkaliphilus]ADH85159.1 pyridoxal phosphate biosynthetic protein PdxJ [Desulfurivibrio alkaliphilus AHT 2]